MFENVNHFIIYCNEQEISDLIYAGIVIVAFVMQFLFLIFYRKKYHISVVGTTTLLITVYPIAYFWLLVITWVENGFKNFGSNNIVRLFVWIPLIAIPIAKLLKIEKRTVTDFLAPSMALEQAIAHTVCPISGCCYGYPFEGGIWNVKLQEYLFPNQWLECLVAFLIFCGLVIYAVKTGFDRRGKIYPVFLIFFGFTRFLLEFLRDNQKLIWGISNLALHALVMVLVGIIWLVRLNKWEKQSNKLPSPGTMPSA